MIGEFVFKYKYDNVDDVEEQEFSPTFTLSADDNIVIISVNGKSSYDLNPCKIFMPFCIELF